ncbi:Os04g0278500 [Oryza sativa Japonica Group]|uniref:Os04g0278500 protein n=1 Tax=Oryza sativa subsp. japonica TaxID=39947 RepID=C7J142_ORYSJ|nr:Os04g0278500 [Oryza sativa Japonica Group]|eukprot:NP_001173832.1 Os04g0278500 [Oryza sativa Japonica Group]
MGRIWVTTCGVTPVTAEGTTAPIKLSAPLQQSLDSMELLEKLESITQRMEAIDEKDGKARRLD